MKLSRYEATWLLVLAFLLAGVSAVDAYLAHRQAVHLRVTASHAP